MEYTSAIDTYVQALADIANALAAHREARSDFDVGFLWRVVHDGFLQTCSDQDQDRILLRSRSNEEFLLWKGPARQQVMNWNCLGWIFPFATETEFDTAYEIITRSELDQKSWAAVRQMWLSLRVKVQQAPFEIPSNLVKIRVTGDACRAAMRMLEQHPPNVRYVTKTLLPRLPSSHYVQRRIQFKLVIGEQWQPFAQTPR